MMKAPPKKPMPVNAKGMKKGGMKIGKMGMGKKKGY